MNRETAQRFISTLRSRCARDSAVAAALRRDSDRTLAETRMLLEWSALFQTVGVSHYEEATCHLVATIFAHDRAVRRHTVNAVQPEDEGEPTEDAGDGPRGRSLGASMASRVAVASSEEAALARRLTSLLTATFEPDGGGSLPWRLRRAVVLLLSRGVSIDWARLATDVSHWNHPERFVQRDWARDFYRDRPLVVHVPAEIDEPEQDDDTTDIDD